MTKQSGTTVSHTTHSPCKCTCMYIYHYHKGSLRVKYLGGTRTDKALITELSHYISEAETLILKTRMELFQGCT